MFNIVPTGKPSTLQKVLNSKKHFFLNVLFSVLQEKQSYRDSIFNSKIILA